MLLFGASGLESLAGIYINYDSGHSALLSLTRMNLSKSYGQDLHLRRWQAGRHLGHSTISLALNLETSPGLIDAENSVELL